VFDLDIYGRRSN